MNRAKRHPRAALAAAFTLVELLVVIGIIALLIGILLPVLSRAREQANSARCGVNMRTATQAMMMYAQQYHGWLPGPHTCGDIWRNAGLADIDTTTTSADTTPIQNMDWMSPTLGLMLKLPENEMQRLLTMYQVQLRCPSNTAEFSSFGLGANIAGVNPQDIPLQSYSAIVHFHAMPGPGLDDVVKPNIASQTSGPIFIPRGYLPKIDRVGAAARKVYLVEGSRYINRSTPPSFNLARYQIQGGNFMITAPIRAQPDTPYDILGTSGTLESRLDAYNKRFAWRHNGRMNLAFFDGHVESRPVSQMVQWELYFPKGSKLQINPSDTYDPTDSVGQVRE